jgi:hypothetical protein
VGPLCNSNEDSEAHAKQEEWHSNAAVEFLLSQSAVLERAQMAWTRQYALKKQECVGYVLEGAGLAMPWRQQEVRAAQPCITRVAQHSLGWQAS